MCETDTKHKDGKPSHTPLPWKLEPKHQIQGRQRFIRGADDSYLVRTGNLGPATKEDDNAEFIVRACNSHYELLEALVSITTYARRLNSTQHAGIDIAPHEWAEMYRLENLARAAIAKATP